MKLGLRHFVLAMLLGVVVYAGAVLYSGYHEIAESLSSFRWVALAAALALASTNYALRFAKWQFYLARLGIRGIDARDSALVFLSGFVLTVTPAKLGEVFKSAVLYRTHGVPMERTAPIVVAERLTDVIAIVVLVALGSAGFAGGLYWALAGAACVALGLVAIGSRSFARKAVARLDRSPRLTRWAPKLAHAYDNLRVVASPGALAWPVVLSIVGWGLEGVALCVLLWGFHQEVSLSFCLFFYSTATLAGALIPVPGGLGVVEAIIFEQLVVVAGVTGAVATASMVLVRMATLWWAVIVGFVALGVLRLHFPSLTRARAPEPRTLT